MYGCKHVLNALNCLPLVFLWLYIWKKLKKKKPSLENEGGFSVKFRFILSRYSPNCDFCFCAYTWLFPSLLRKKKCCSLPSLVSLAQLLSLSLSLFFNFADYSVLQTSLWCDNAPNISFDVVFWTPFKKICIKCKILPSLPFRVNVWNEEQRVLFFLLHIKQPDLCCSLSCLPFIPEEAPPRP